MASSVDARRHIKNAPLRLYGVILDFTTGLPLSGGLTGMDAEISADGGAFTDLATAEAEIGTTGYFRVDFTATETAYDHCVLQFKASNTNAVTYIEKIEFEQASDSGVAQSATSSTIVLRAAAVASNDYYNGQQIEIVRGTGAGQLRTITDYVGSSKTVTIDRIWITTPDSTSVYVIKNQGQTLGLDVLAKVNATQIGSEEDAATALGYLYKGGITMAEVDDAGATTTVFIGDASLSAIDDFYNKALLVFVTGALAGEAEKIDDYVGATKSITMAHAFAAVPADTDQFVILGKIR